MDILEYSNDLTNKEFVSTDIDDNALASLLKPTAEEVEKEKKEEEEKERLARQQQL
jgi:hypothetical protein